MPYEPSDTIGALTDAELATFLAEPWNGRLATITPEGWPYMAPVWYEFERDRRGYRVTPARGPGRPLTVRSEFSSINCDCR
jgi:nitroimidazol reductase NimA-like FMN-containing flavoprotein (pyridoxamine 5'-phosphate oxidase superfamily)